MAFLVNRADRSARDVRHRNVRDEGPGDGVDAVLWDLIVRKLEYGRCRPRCRSPDCKCVAGAPLKSPLRNAASGTWPCVRRPLSSLVRTKSPKKNSLLRLRGPPNVKPACMYFESAGGRVVNGLRAIGPLGVAEYEARPAESVRSGLNGDVRHRAAGCRTPRRSCWWPPRPFQSPLRTGYRKRDCRRCRYCRRPRAARC